MFKYNILEWASVFGQKLLIVALLWRDSMGGSESRGTASLTMQSLASPTSNPPVILAQNEVVDVHASRRRELSDTIIENADTY